jgi:hypothetical protein
LLVLARSFVQFLGMWQSSLSVADEGDPTIGNDAGM